MIRDTFGVGRCSRVVFRRQSKRTRQKQAIACRQRGAASWTVSPRTPDRCNGPSTRRRGPASTRNFTSVRQLERTLEQSEQWRPPDPRSMRNRSTFRNPNDLVGRFQNECELRYAGIANRLDTDTSRCTCPRRWRRGSRRGVEEGSIRSSHQRPRRFETRQLGLSKRRLVSQWGEFLRSLDAEDTGRTIPRARSNHLVLTSKTSGNASNLQLTRNMPVDDRPAAVPVTPVTVTSRSTKRKNYPLPKLLSCPYCRPHGLEVDHSHRAPGTMEGLNVFNERRPRRPDEGVSVSHPTPIRQNCSLRGDFLLSGMPGTGLRRPTLRPIAPDGLQKFGQRNVYFNNVFQTF